MARSATILFAEDDTPIRNTVADLLSLRFRVLVAEDGYQALRFLARENVDVLFTDIVMPGMNGVEVARQAKRLQPQIKVMFMTGYAARAAEAAHLGKLLYKPLRLKEIDAELCSLLEVA
jgi:two-component system, cell cycle response regulator CpdR